MTQTATTAETLARIEAAVVAVTMEDEAEVDFKQSERMAAKLPTEAKTSEAPPRKLQEPLAKRIPIQVSADKTTPPVVIKGNMLFDSATGARFFAKGVAYNPRNVKFAGAGDCLPGEPQESRLDYAEDPTTEKHEALWSEALEGIAAMGANTVRLYNIDPLESHEKFMKKASALGLYVIVPLTRHDWGYLPAGLPSPACYTEDKEGYGNVGTNLVVSAKLIVKQFSQYDNVLMFTVANELTIADQNGYAAFPCVKALTRDIHLYQQECGRSMRRIPLIYSDMDMGAPWRGAIANYLACELESPEDALDAYGLNVYSWCDTEYPDATGKHNFKHSPYYPIHEEFSDFSKPLLFTEFGCNAGAFQTTCPYKGGRTWTGVPTFFDEFKEIMSGAIAFEFSMEDNQYGLTLTPGYTADPLNDGKIYYLDSYYALKKAFEANQVSSLWDGAEVATCRWQPTDAHKMEYEHKLKKCPTEKEVQKLFKAKGMRVAPNWHTLPPTPVNTSQDLLEKCAEFPVSNVIYAESCCHMQCE